MTHPELIDMLKSEALKQDDQPLMILGHEVDKTDAQQVYGALCWIENQLLEMLKRRL